MNEGSLLVKRELLNHSLESKAQKESGLPPTEWEGKSWLGRSLTGRAPFAECGRKGGHVWFLRETVLNGTTEGTLCTILLHRTFS